MQRLKRFKLGHWLLLCLIPLGSLFFVGGPDTASLPSVRSFWNFGHIVFFFLLSVGYAIVRPFKSSRQIIVFVAAVLLISLLIEFTQSFVGRHFSLMDVLRNLTGCVIGLFLRARPLLPVAIFSVFSFVFVVEIYGLSLTIFGDIKQQNRGPIIEDFESGLLVERWQGAVVASELYVLSGQYSGKAVFSPGKYPSIHLSPLLKNWTGYDAFEINVFVPGYSILSLNVRLHDQIHHQNQARIYGDRFNRNVQIEPGWNKLTLPLKAILEAPNGRSMDLTKMSQLSFFFVDLKQTQQLYFDDIRLVNFN
ncbi:MAG: VanZ family protein [Gammaproteobacteria bacterium]|nr:VanZ family protein [Gammaproteobacteria bacterium]